MAIPSRTYFVYINEKCHLLSHDPEKRAWLMSWMQGRIAYTSPDTPPPFGLYPIAMMVHYGIERYTNLCVWQVSHWGSKLDPNGVEPLELKYRSAAEKQFCLDAVYEWVEAHPFERFQHEGSRGSLTHEVRVYDLPTPVDEVSRCWRAHWKRWAWIQEDWEALALGLAARKGNEPAEQTQNNMVDLTHPSRVQGRPGNNNAPEIPDPVQEYPAMLPQREEQQTYKLPPAPVPSAFIPPTLSPQPRPMPVTPESKNFPFSQVTPSPVDAGAYPPKPTPLGSCYIPGVSASYIHGQGMFTSAVSGLDWPSPLTPSPNHPTALPVEAPTPTPTPTPAPKPEPEPKPKPPSPPRSFSPYNIPLVGYPLNYMILGTKFAIKKEGRKQQNVTPSHAGSGGDGDEEPGNITNRDMEDTLPQEEHEHEAGYDETAEEEVPEVENAQGMETDSGEVETMNTSIVTTPTRGQGQATRGGTGRGRGAAVARGRGRSRR